MLDERDLDIIAALQEDARATYADVAARVGMSASAVHERVRKLEQSGVIRSYRAVVDPEALGLFVTALIAATPLDPQQPDDLPDRVAEFPEVEDCFSVAGEANYILKVRTPRRRRPGGSDPAPQGEGQRRDAHDDRAVDPVRGPTARHVGRRNHLPEGSISRGTPRIMVR